MSSIGYLARFVDRLGQTCVDIVKKHIAVSDSMWGPAWIAALECSRDAASRAIQAEAGTEGVCQLQRDGRVTGGLKVHEGRLVALSRLLRQAHGLAPEAIAALVDAECTRWEADLAAHRAKPRPSVPWIAYLQGGLDACLEAQDLQTFFTDGVTHAD